VIETAQNEVMERWDALYAYAPARLLLLLSLVLVALAGLVRAWGWLMRAVSWAAPATGDAATAVRGAWDTVHDAFRPTKPAAELSLEAEPNAAPEGASLDEDEPSPDYRRPCDESGARGDGAGNRRTLESQDAGDSPIHRQRASH
jgi:hypothetical protein